MNVKINDSIIRTIFDDDNYKNEIVEFLNLVIDEEIAKGDDMNDELVSECVDALMSIEEGNIEKAIDDLRGSKNIIKFVHKKNFRGQTVRRSIAAAIALILIAHTTAYNTVPTYASAVDSFVQSIIDIIQNDAKETEDGTDECSQIYVDYPEGFNGNINSEEEADLKGCRVFAVDYDGNEKEIPLSDCTVKKHILEDDGKKYVEVSVSYKGCVDIVRYQLNGGK